MVKEAKGRVPVIVGSAAERTEDAIDYSRDAEKAGADGLMIIPPFYSSPTPDELVEHFRRIAAAVSIPIMVYNNPFTANVDLKPETVARLAEIDKVRYIKELSGDVTRVTQILRLCGDRMKVFAGYYPWEAYRCGATGYVSVFANISPACRATCSSRRWSGTTARPAAPSTTASCRCSMRSAATSTSAPPRLRST